MEDRYILPKGSPEKQSFYVRTAELRWYRIHHLISRFFAFDPTPVSGKIPVEIRPPLPRWQFVYDFFVFLKLSRDKFGNRRKWILYQLTSYRSVIFKIYGINSGHGGARQNRIVTV